MSKPRHPPIGNLTPYFEGLAPYESPSPECSPVRESFAQIIRNFSPSSDDSDSESDTTKKQAWSADESSDSSSDEDE